MCEHYVARSARPFRLDELWEMTERLEQWGQGGYGWGAAWLTGDGRIASHRDAGSFRADPRREEVGRNETTSMLLHLRRPSKFSTIGLPDTQPFDDPAGRYSFSHNGDLLLHREWRGRYREQGRIRGKADTEVGARWLEDEWRDGESVPHLLGALHDTFGGEANLAVVTADGAVCHYAGNAENPVFTFRLGDIGLACTGMYSLDRSVFKYVAHGATDRRLVPYRTAASLDAAGRPAQGPPIARVRRSGDGRGRPAS
jgi:glutamine phosphoribosylpyrophosphate amidotransferase